LNSTQGRVISRICPQCGRVLEESWVSCPYCGKNLTGTQEPLRTAFGILSFFKTRIAFVVCWSLYFFGLLGSFLLPLSNPFLSPYCWVLVPVLANFFVGYFVGDVHTAIKIIVVCFLLFPIVVIGLLSTPSVYDAFWHSFEVRGLLGYPHLIISLHSDVFIWLVILVVGYPILHILLGVSASFIGVFARERLGPQRDYIP